MKFRKLFLNCAQFSHSFYPNARKIIEKLQYEFEKKNVSIRANAYRISRQIEHRNRYIIHVMKI